MVSLRAIGHATLSRFSAALSYRDFRNMWLANMSAQAAAWGLIVSRGWLVFDMTHSSASVGVVTFASMAPQTVVPAIAGVLADRIDRRRLLGWTYSINFLHNLALGALALSGDIVMWHIVLLALVNGVARATQMTTSQALAATLVPRDKLLNALSLNASTMHGSRLIGPGLVTPLIAFLGVPAAFFLCSGLYGLGWLQLRRIQTPSYRGGVRKDESFWHSLGDGFRYTWSQPLIRMVVVMVTFHCGLTMAFESLLPAFSSQRLEAGATGFGTLMMGVGGGALVGSFFIGGIQSARARGRLYLVMGVLSGLGQVMLSFTSTMGVAVVAAAIMGSTQAAFMTLGQAITQSLAADEYRGRVASLNALSLGSVMSTMNLTNGFLNGHFGATTILLVDGLAFAGIMAASIAVSIPRNIYVKGLPAEATAGEPHIH